MLILVWFALSSQLSTGRASDTFVFTAASDEDESRLRLRFNKVAIYLVGTIRRANQIYSCQVVCRCRCCV